MVPVVLSALLTVSIMVLSSVSLNFANIIALPLLFGIGVDNGIHIVHRYRMAPPSGTNLMATSTVRAVFFGTLTTIASFGSLSLSSHYGMATMGDTPLDEAARVLGIDVPAYRGGGFDRGGLLSPVMSAFLAVAEGRARHVLVYRTVQMIGGSIAPPSGSRDSVSPSADTSSAVSPVSTSYSGL